MRVLKKTEKAGVEEPVCRWADRNGIMHRKLNGFGRNGWPDREFYLPGGKPLLIEFKRPGEGLAPLQEKTIAELRKIGYDIEVHDDKDEAIAAIKARMRNGR